MYIILKIHDLKFVNPLINDDAGYSFWGGSNSNFSAK
jgi:hypothetical protein